jgi:ubiquinone biosynthesis monooxygenase Coq7
MIRPTVGDMPDARQLSRRLQADLRSDHAGETGAVWIYKGILALTRNAEIRRFASEHLVAEQQHLDFFEQWLPSACKSRLLILWRLAGWSLGAVAAVGGKRAVYLTVESVETFVVQHYQDQINYLEERDKHRQIQAVLGHFQADEDQHRIEAADAWQRARKGMLARCWCSIVGEGSRLAVIAARRV